MRLRTLKVLPAAYRKEFQIVGRKMGGQSCTQKEYIGGEWYYKGAKNGHCVDVVTVRITNKMFIIMRCFVPL